MRKTSTQILTIILSFCSVLIYGQSAPDFNMLVDKAFEKLYQNPDECINYSQSLLIVDQNVEHKIVLQNIISQAYSLKGDYVQSVTISTQKEDNQKRESLSYFMQMFADYNLADQYQNLGLYNQSQKIISNLLADEKLFRRSPNPKSRITIAKLYQLQSINFGITKDYVKAIENIHKSNQYLDNKNAENRIIGFENKIFQSSYLMRLNKLEEAKTLITKTIKEIEKLPNQPFLYALAYENLSRYYFLTEDYQTSVMYLEKALSRIDGLAYNNMRIKIYGALFKNYFALHNDKEFQKYNDLYTESKADVDANKRDGIRYIVKLVESYQNNNLEFQRQTETKRFWTLAFIFFLLILAGMIYFLIQLSRNRDLKKQTAFFKKQKSREQTVPILVSVIKEEITPVDKNIVEKDSSKISKEKEDEILQKLDEWERSDHYLNKNMSLATLSAQMGINTKYLSEVINNSKGKNFNAYINELRINHIAHLLKTDPTYLNYKVSYLAEFSGFSSHSAFTTVFKSVTGMSPNAYIQEISKKNAS